MMFAGYLGRCGGVILRMFAEDLVRRNFSETINQKKKTPNNPSKLYFAKLHFHILFNDQDVCRNCLDGWSGGSLVSWDWDAKKDPRLCPAEHWRASVPFCCQLVCFRAPGVHPTRWIVYSANFSRSFRGSFWGCARLFGDYLGVIWEVFCEDFEGKTIQRVNAKSGKTVFFTITNSSR